MKKNQQILFYLFFFPRPYKQMGCPVSQGFHELSQLFHQYPGINVNAVPVLPNCGSKFRLNDPSSIPLLCSSLLLPIQWYFLPIEKLFWCIIQAPPPPLITSVMPRVPVWPVALKSLIAIKEIKERWKKKRWKELSGRYFGNVNGRQLKKGAIEISRKS